MARMSPPQRMGRNAAKPPAPMRTNNNSKPAPFGGKKAAPFNNRKPPKGGRS